MSTDLKIDLFARDLFDALWRQHGLRTEPPKSERPLAESEFDNNILRCVEARQAIFHSAYEEIFENSHRDFSGDSRYFFLAIAERFPHHHPEEDTVPEKDAVMRSFLCSCAFVADMVMWCESRGDDFLDVADRAWAMFVDLHLKEAFYEAGGWDELEKFAEAELVVCDYVRTFSDMVNCNRGKNVLLHQPHLTIGAIESFRWFEAWPGVDDDDPMVLEWVDFCVLEPARKIRPARHFRRADPEVFKELESTIYELGKICNPHYPEEDPEATDIVVACSPNVDFDRQSRHPNCDDTPSTTPTGRFDPSKADEYVSRSNAVKLRATDPVQIARSFEASEQPVYFFSVNAANNDSNIDGEEGKNSESRSPITEKGNLEESLSETSKKKRNSEIADYEQDIVVKKLRSSSEVQMDLKIRKMETDGESIPDYKNALPVCSDGLASRMESDNRVFEETLSRFSSLGVSVTVLNPEDFGAANDSDESNMNIDSNDFDTIMEKLGLKKMPDFSSPDSRVKVYVSTIDSDNIANSDGSLGETTRSSLLTPRKSRPSSTNGNIFNTPRNSQLNSTNMNVSNTPCKSPLTSTNVNVSNSPRKSPLTSTNVNVSNTPCKSPLTSTNVNVSNTPCKSPLTSTKINTVRTSDKSPDTSTNVSVSSIKDGTLCKRNKKSVVSGGRRRGKRFTGKENLLSYESKDQENKHPDKDSYTLDNLFFSSVIKKHNALKKAKDPFLPDKEDSELVNLAKHSVKTYGRTKQIKVENKPNDLINEISILDHQKTSETTIESSPSDQCVKDIKIIDPSKYPSGRSTCEGSNYPQNQPEDKLHENPSSRPEMANPPRRNSILTNNDEKDLIPENSLKVFECVEKNDLSRPPVEKGCERSNRRISRDSSSTEIHEMTEGENSSSGTAAGNTFIHDSGVEAEDVRNNANLPLDCEKSFNAENETTSAETTDENPFGLDGEKAKQESKSKDPNSEASQTDRSESTTAESVSENPFDFPSEPQDVEKKGKKKRHRKRPTRLEQRVREEGNGVRDVMRLLLVMGHQPSMANFASTLQDAEERNSEDEDNEE